MPAGILVNVVRINFSHGSVEEHLGRVKAVRNWAHDNNTKNAPPPVEM
jgi:pyruvate kinase